MFNPDGADSGREWVELYNAGSDDVTIVGGTIKGSWRISDTTNHTLIDPKGGVGRGDLAIPAGGYLIISNDPTTFLAEHTSGSYSVIKSSISLNNTGGTVMVFDGNGSTLDSVPYSKDQGASDDGMSLQKTSSGAWIAALPTPGSANATAAYIPPADASVSASTSTQSNAVTSVQGTVTSYVAPPSPSIFVDAGDDRTVTVGADVEFDGGAYDRTQHILDASTVRYIWNFGDGAIAEGAAVLHHWEYPGTYAVVLSIASDRTAVSDTIIVTAEAAQITFSNEADGSASIANTSKHNLDLSNWIIRNATQVFTLPSYTLILANHAMRISAAKLGFIAASSSYLEYPNGALAATSSSEILPLVNAGFAPPLASANMAQPRPALKVAPSPDLAKNISAAAVKANTKTNNLIPPDVSTSSLASQLAAASTSSGPWWYLSAFSLVAFGAGALYMTRKRPVDKKPEEWDIIEEAQE